MFLIMGKRVARLGDATTHGGRIITASPTVTDEGIPIARVGDKVTCPKCGGTHVIIEGAPTAFDKMHNIARDGDAVSCGAKLIAGSGSGNMQGGFFGLWEDEPEPEPVPGRGLSKEEYCKYAMALQNSQVFKDTLRHMTELTKRDDAEYSCWFVQDPDGTIRAVNLKTDGLELWVDPGKKPEGAIAQVHTHTRAIFPSEQDGKYYSTQPLENRPYVYGVANSGKVWMLNDEGKDLICGTNE